MTETFRQGRIPDDKQINETLDYVKTTSLVDINQQCPEVLQTVIGTICATVKTEDVEAKMVRCKRKGKG